MKITVKASKRSQILREQSKYIEDYNAKKKEFDEQSDKFESEYSTYVDKVTQQVRELFKEDIAKLPGLSIGVRKDEYPSQPKDYVIQFSYTDPKQSDPVYLNRTKGNYHSLRGISWAYYIYLYGRCDYKDGERIWKFELRKEPQLNGTLLSPTDYPTLKATLDLFDKIETIDWESELNRIWNEVPKRNDYIVTKDPGRLNTASYQSKLDEYDISRIVGKDIWIKVNITREQSYDRWSEYSNAQGVDSDGFVKVDSQTDKFYVIHWLAYRDKIRNTNFDFSLSKLKYAIDHTYKLKKIYFSVIRPIEYFSTEELQEELIPDYHPQSDTEES